MYRGFLFAFVVVFGLGAFIWASDRITLEGERTVYTVACEQGTWDGLRCTGRITAGDRHRFRSSKSRHEVAYWIAGSPAPSGKYIDCVVTDRDRWTCDARVGDQPSITHEFSDGRPANHISGLDTPFHAVAKWKWWALRAGIPGFDKADFSNSFDPLPTRTPLPEPGRK